MGSGKSTAAHLLRQMGFDVLDASLGKQSAGVLNFIKKIQNGTPAIVAPDGPHGPIYEAKPGVIYMAAKAGSVVVPMITPVALRVVTFWVNWSVTQTVPLFATVMEAG